MTTGSPATLADDREVGEFDARADRVAQWRAAALVVAALVVVGALLGVLWQAWSPPGPAGAVLRAGIQPDETEAFVGADGRYAVLTLVVGLAAGVAAWYLRRVRGPVLALALAVGAVGGALLTDLVGWALRGQGQSYVCGSDTGRCIDHLRLGVHMHALWFGEAVAALLVYSLFVAFAVADDLGRPDPGRGAAVTGVPGQPAQPEHLARPADRTEPAAEPDGSVGPQRDLQDGGRHGDTPGVAQ